MAKVKTKPASNMPEGFEPVSSKMDGFFLVEEGNSVQGILVDSYINNKSEYGPKKVYKICLTAGTTRVVVGKDKNEVEAEEGATIGLDEKGYLKKLSDVAKGSEVFIKCTGKEPSAKKGQSPAWTFDIGVSGGKIPF